MYQYIYTPLTGNGAIIKETITTSGLIQTTSLTGDYIITLNLFPL